MMFYVSQIGQKIQNHSADNEFTTSTHYEEKKAHLKIRVLVEAKQINHSETRTAKFLSIIGFVIVPVMCIRGYKYYSWSMSKVSPKYFWDQLKQTFKHYLDFEALTRFSNTFPVGWWVGGSINGN